MTKNEVESRLTQIKSMLDKLRDELSFYELEKIQLECILRDMEISKSRINIDTDESNIENTEDYFEPYYFGKEY